MAINKEWHLAHKMPKNASPEQRIEWHLGHAKNCSCREMPAGFIEKIKQEIKQKKKRREK
ncbi:MAG TPA: hypothetical protein VI977_05125 [archaeon]|nr:hypothetical protein [archaeon]